MSYFGIPVQPTLRNFYAWTPKDGHIVPEWIDDYFPNGDSDEFIVYTQDPMKKFLMKKDDVIVRCGLGSAIIFLIIKPDMWENWWEINQKKVDELIEAEVVNFDFKEQVKFLTK